jgi:hypothetical protein
MATLFSRLFNGSPAGMDKAVVGEKPNPAKNLPKADIKAAVFFDGTLNNRANTRVRQATQKELEEQVGASRRRGRASPRCPSRGCYGPDPS